MKTTKSMLVILHYTVWIMLMTALAGAVFVLCFTADFGAIVDPGTSLYVLRLSQGVLALSAVPAGYAIDKGLDKIFSKIEEILVEEEEEA